jgi:cyclic pyranopterin phosphate synthase
MDNELTHFDDQGRSRMVDVGQKEITVRTARASAVVKMGEKTGRLIQQQKMKKGDVLEVARLAGIMAAKRTAELIPLCHLLPLDSIELGLEFAADHSLVIEATVRVTARTGVEMEALTAVSVASLTVYDMCKSVDRSMTIAEVQLVEKSGGRSGHFIRKE